MLAHDEMLTLVLGSKARARSEVEVNGIKLSFDCLAGFEKGGLRENITTSFSFEIKSKMGLIVYLFKVKYQKTI